MINNSTPSSVASQRTHTLRARFATICAGVVLLTAAIILFEWLIGSALMTWPGDRFVPMAPSTAALFLLLGGTILFHAWRGASAVVRPIVWMAPATVLFVAILLMTQFFARTQFGIASDLERHIAPTSGVLGLVPLERMSPLTAILFILLAAQTMVFSMPRFRPSGDILGNVVVTLAGVLMIGYWYDAPLLYGGRVVPVAFSTAVLFLLSAVALFAADSRSWLVHITTSNTIQARFIRGVMPTAVLLLLIDGWIDTRVFSMMKIQYYVLLTVFSHIFIALIITIVVVFVGREVETRVHHAEQDLRASEAEFRSLAEELRARNEELSRFNRDMSGRELRMIELKQEVNALAARFGQPQPYALAFLEKPISQKEKSP